MGAVPSTPTPHPRLEDRMKELPLRCPCAVRAPLKKGETGYQCDQDDCPHSKATSAFPISNGIPVLVSEERTDTVCSMVEDVTYISRPRAKYTGLKKLIVGESRTTTRNCNRFVSEVLALSDEPRVLVIGGGEQGFGTSALWNDDRIDIHSIDIYGAETVDVICDAHYLPFQSDYYDGVWIQAVLEHVVEPTKVAAEIHRVLRHGGIVYAETPFMQQVHEGAYDFTRYTVLGHRYLFKDFEAVDMGGNKGPEVVFSWSFRYLVWAVTRSRKVARVMGLAFGILMRPFGYLVSARSMHDAASGVYFLGRKSDNPPVTHKELVTLYKGQFP